MLFPRRTLSIALGALLLAVCTPARGQDEPARPSYARLLNIDALIEHHARFLARHYNLSEDQDAYTQAYLRQKADEFLSRHREELYDLVDRLFEVRAGGQITSEDLITWGKRAQPLYEEAKALIVQGNNEWREILTEEQRKTHDKDLEEMYNSFVTTEDQLQRIVTGQMTLDEFRRGPARQVPRAAPAEVTTGTVAPQADPAPGHTTRTHVTPRPTQPGVGDSAGATGRPGRGPGGGDRRLRGRGGPPVNAGKAGANFESQWEAYVREFIQRYQLDEGQTQRAQSILKDCQDMAQRIMQKNKAAIEELDKKVLELGQSKEGDKLRELTEINARRTKLTEPIDQIFERQLKPRLEKLPTRAQRQAAEATSRPAVGAPGRKPGVRPTPNSPPQPPQPRPQPQQPPPQPQPQPQPPPQPPPQPEPEPEPIPEPQPMPPEEEPPPQPEPVPPPEVPPG